MKAREALIVAVVAAMLATAVAGLIYAITHHREPPLEGQRLPTTFQGRRST